VKWRGRASSANVQDFSQFPVIDLTPKTMLSQPIVFDPEELSYEQTYQSLEPPLEVPLPKAELSRDAFARLLSKIKPNWHRRTN
jgi:hypothetical protein